MIDKYENFDKLTIAMLNEFIEKILVHERDRKGSIQTTQEVEIYFNFVAVSYTHLDVYKRQKQSPAFLPRQMPLPSPAATVFSGNADRAYNTLHFAPQSRVPNGALPPLETPATNTVSYTHLK